jgi:hypothetical protein
MASMARVAFWSYCRYVWTALGVCTLVPEYIWDRRTMFPFLSMMAHELDGLRAASSVGLGGMERTEIPRLGGDT